MPNKILTGIVELLVISGLLAGALSIISSAQSIEYMSMPMNNPITVPNVTMKDFLDALKEVGPSVSPDMEKWYKGFMQQVRQVQKPSTPIA